MHESLLSQIYVNFEISYSKQIVKWMLMIKHDIVK